MAYNKDEKYIVRPALESDVPGILAVNHAYFPIEGASVQANIEEMVKRGYGFLLEKFKEEEVKGMCKNTIIVETNDSKKEIVGYFLLFRARFHQLEKNEDNLKRLQWEGDALLKEIVFGDLQNPTCVVPSALSSPLVDHDVILQAEICVKPEYTGKGVGTFAQKKIYENTAWVFPPGDNSTPPTVSRKGVVFYSYIVISPFYNAQSIKFNEKMGFSRQGKFTKEEYATLKNYESLCYVKVINFNQ